MNFIINFIKSIKDNEYLDVIKKDNGYVISYPKFTDFSTMFEFFTPLNNEEINLLEEDVNQAQGSNFCFPDWYREFLKITNGMNLFFGCLCFYGSQTPLIETDNGYMRKQIERNNSNWVAPFSLMTPGSVKYDEKCKNRWFVFAGFRDNTLVAYDYKTNKIVRMYKDPIDLSMKKWKCMREIDYEKKIISTWENFEKFFNEQILIFIGITKEWLKDDNIYKKKGFDRQLELWSKIK